MHDKGCYHALLAMCGDKDRTSFETKETATMTREQKRRHDEAVLTVLSLYGSTMYAYGRAATSPGPQKELMRDLALGAARGALSALLLAGPTEDDVTGIVDMLEARE